MENHGEGGFWQRPTLAQPRDALPSGLRRFRARVPNEIHVLIFPDVHLVLELAVGFLESLPRFFVGYFELPKQRAGTGQ